MPEWQTLFRLVLWGGVCSECTLAKRVLDWWLDVELSLP